MAEFKDYYQILQVHHQAEMEVIEGAYKRLVKKYHPDLNPGAGASERMRDINIAYHVLRDPVQRRDYHLQWQQKSAAPSVAPAPRREPRVAPAPQAVAAQSVLHQYFQGIAARNFAKAYDHISENDKKMISREDFCNWQNEVAKVFALRQFQSAVSKIQQNGMLRGCLYREIVEFRTETMEFNVVMDRMEKDEFLKKVVSENGAWKVFLGYDGLQPFIDKFQKLAKLISAKSVLRELNEVRERTDAATDLLNQRGFTERVENELARFQRYGNVFSVIFFELTFSGNHPEEALKKFGQILTANLRRLDVIGRWEDMKLAVLLPETGLAAGVRVALKIREIARLAKLDHSGTWCAGIHCGVIESGAGLPAEIFRWAEYYLNIAKRNGVNKIASSNGIL